MKTLILGILVILLFLAGFNPARAGLYRIPNHPCSWTVTYTYKQKDNGPAAVRPEDPAQAKLFDRAQMLSAKVASRIVYFTPERRHQVTTWTSGKTTDDWYVNNYYLFSAINYPPGVVTYNAPGQFERPVDFPELSWVTKDCLVGEEDYKGTSANHYVYPPPPKPSDDPAAPAPAANTSPKQEAWIDVKTGFPLFMENDAISITYTLQDSPPSPAGLIMAPEFQQIWDHISRQP